MYTHNFALTHPHTHAWQSLCHTLCHKLFHTIFIQTFFFTCVRNTPKHTHTMWRAEFSFKVGMHCELECEVSGVVQCHSQGCVALLWPKENSALCILLFGGNLEKESLLCVCIHTHPQTHTPSHTHMFKSVLAHTNSSLRDRTYSSINTLPPPHAHNRPAITPPSILRLTNFSPTLTAWMKMLFHS